MRVFDSSRQHAETRATTFIQRSVASPAARRDRSFDAVDDALSSRGRALGTETQRFMAARLGHDFSSVRVHDDAGAARAARALEARAFTSGQEIVFGAGEYRPDTSDGQRLLAHELIHTLQQRSARQGARGSRDVSQPGDSSEREADSIADTAMRSAARIGAGPVRVAPSRAAIARAPLKTGSGTFKVENYTETDGDPGKDTAKRVGAAIDITFTSNESVRSDKLAYVHIMKTTKNGSPYLFENEKPRATEAKDGDPGWAVDRVAGMKSPIYNQENDGTAAGNTKFGYRKSKTDHKPAWMHDGIKLNRAVGMTVTVDATAFVLDATAGKYLGALAWGFSTDAKGKTTKKAESVHAQGNPAGIQKRALERWNEQAANTDVSKRNAADQEKVPVP